MLFQIWVTERVRMSILLAWKLESFFYHKTSYMECSLRVSWSLEQHAVHDIVEKVRSSVLLKMRNPSVIVLHCIHMIVIYDSFILFLKVFICFMDGAHNILHDLSDFTEKTIFSGKIFLRGMWRIGNANWKPTRMIHLEI